MADLRTCRTCGPKTTTDFAPHKTKGFQNQCRDCRAEYNRKHYLQHKAKYVARAKKRNEEIREDAHEKLVEYLSEHPCAKCGEKDIVVLEFHHKDAEEKEFGIAKGLSNGLSWERLLGEIQKCKVLCANDHKREHAKERNTYRHRARSGIH